MTVQNSAIDTTRARQRALSRLSPFELKDNLIALARGNIRKGAAAMLNAGRGNPNWIAAEPRDAFFLLGRFAMGEGRRVRDEGMLAGMPDKNGIAERFRFFLEMCSSARGADFLARSYEYAVTRSGFDADTWVHEMTDALIGDNYPEPDRMLVHAEKIVHDYLVKELCAGQPPEGRYDLFAVEGGTAAMCYIFDSLMQNGLLKQGDRIAIMAPVFTPYIEIAGLERFSFRVVPIQASEARADGSHTWHYPEAELDKLAETQVKLMVCVNPSNPPSIALTADERRRIAGIVRDANPDLMIITDDVYATFVPGFRSLMADLPENVIGVYSFSKNFGCTGWRLGVIAVHEKNVMDRKIAELPATAKGRLKKRYGSLSLEPEKIKFIDRMVADSRCVALNHTAGLSLPQQAQMALFALSHLLDPDDGYKRQTIALVQGRRDLLWHGLGIALPPMDPDRAWYYVELDLEVWAKRMVGEGFFEYLTRNYEPVDFIFRLAEQSSVVLLDGGGFGGPKWSVRVSLANLDDDDYARIGEHMRDAARDYIEAWQADAAGATGATASGGPGHGDRT
jgi:aspartate 4-decarboxylase